MDLWQFPRARRRGGAKPDRMRAGQCWSGPLKEQPQGCKMSETSQNHMGREVELDVEWIYYY